MSEAELKTELQYRYEERMGLLTDSLKHTSTLEQLAAAREIARREADQWVADYRKAGELL